MRLSVYSNYFSSSRIINHDCFDSDLISNNLHLLDTIEDIDFHGLESFKEGAVDSIPKHFFNHFDG